MGICSGIAALILLCIVLASPGTVFAGGGPLGIDSRLHLDQQGIWKRSNQRVLEGLVVGGVLAGSLWEGNESRMGKTFWQSTDSVLIGQGVYLVLNKIFRRPRPSQTDDPSQWFNSGGDWGIDEEQWNCWFTTMPRCSRLNAMEWDRLIR